MIPKIIRFVWIDKNKSHELAIIPKEYQICIMSAVVMNPGFKVVVHSNIPLDYDTLMINNKTRVINEIISSDLIEEAHSYGIQKRVAHVSDYIRYKLLYEYGGFYLDTDVFCLKSLEDLTDKHCVLAREKPTTVCCAAFGFEPNHELIKIVLDGYHTNYVESEWLYNSQLVLKNGSKKFSSEDVTILEYEKGFFYPNWKFYPMCMFYDKFNISKKEDIQTKFKGYTQHLWSSTNSGTTLRQYIIDNLESNDESYIIQLFNFYRSEYSKLLEE